MESVGHVSGIAQRTSSVFIWQLLHLFYWQQFLIRFSWSLRFQLSAWDFATYNKSVVCSTFTYFPWDGAACPFRWVSHFSPSKNKFSLPQMMNLCISRSKKDSLSATGRRLSSTAKRQRGLLVLSLGIIRVSVHAPLHLQFGEMSEHSPKRYRNLKAVCYARSNRKSNRARKRTDIYRRKKRKIRAKLVETPLKI